MNEVYRIFILLVTLWETLCEPCVPNCVKMEIVDNPSTDDVIPVEENLVVNLTFRVDTKSCTDDTQQWLLKLSTFQKEKAIDKCKIPFINRTCQTKEQEEPCSCLKSDMLLVQIHEDFNESYYQVYSWTGISNGTSTNVTPFKKIFMVVKSNTEKNQTKTSRDNHDVQYLCLSLPVVIAVCASVAAIVVVIAIIFIVRSCKTKSKSPRTDIAPYDNRQSYDHLSRL